MKIGSLLVGSIVSALVLFVWGFVFWVVLPFSKTAVNQLEGPADVQAAASLIEGLQLQDGLTVFPHPSDQASPDLTRGPFLEISYASDVTYMDPMVFAAGLLHYFVSAVFFGVLLGLARSALPTYASRVLFGLLFGITATVLLNLGQPIWFHRSWTYALGVAGYDTGMGLLLGLVQGGFIKPAPQAKA